jgi:hypothetical protein
MGFVHFSDVIDEVIDDQVKKFHDEERPRRGTMGSRELEDVLAADRSGSPEGASRSRSTSFSSAF